MAGAAGLGRMGRPGTPLGGSVLPTEETGPRPQTSSPPTFPCPRDPAEEDCALTGRRPRHGDHDGLRQRVQVGAVGTQALAAAAAGARARLILRQTLREWEA